MARVLGAWAAGAGLVLMATAAAAAEPAQRFVMIGTDGPAAAFADAAGVRREGDLVVMPVLFVPGAPSGSGPSDLNYGVAEVVYDCQGRTTQMRAGDTYNIRDERYYSGPMNGPLQPLKVTDKAQYSGFAIACGLPDAPTSPAFGSAVEAVKWHRGRLGG